jgi:hypothetical protein
MILMHQPSETYIPFPFCLGESDGVCAAREVVLMRSETATIPSEVRCREDEAAVWGWERHSFWRVGDLSEANQVDDGLRWRAFLDWSYRCDPTLRG